MIPVLGGAKGSDLSQCLLFHEFQYLMPNWDAGSIADGVIAMKDRQQSLATMMVIAHLPPWLPNDSRKKRMKHAFKRKVK